LAVALLFFYEGNRPFPGNSYSIHEPETSAPAPKLKVHKVGQGPPTLEPREAEHKTPRWR